MKKIGDNRKQQRQVEGKPERKPCGTLCYLAESRGGQRKSEPARWTETPDGVCRNART